MGLDIRAYKKLHEVTNPVLDEIGYPEDYDNQWKPGASMDWSESLWPGKGYPLDSKTVYEWEDIYTFRAGSYINYVMWRESLREFKGDVAFQELIYFADNEGVIGSKLAEKLYNDFVTHYEEVKQYSANNKDDWFIQKYEDWMKAFEFAADNGAVEFC